MVYKIITLETLWCFMKLLVRVNFDVRQRTKRWTLSSMIGTSSVTIPNTGTTQFPRKMNNICIS